MWEGKPKQLKLPKTRKWTNNVSEVWKPEYTFFSAAIALGVLPDTVWYHIERCVVVALDIVWLVITKFWVVRYVWPQIMAKWTSRFLTPTIKNVCIEIPFAELTLQISLHFFTSLSEKLNHKIKMHFLAEKKVQEKEKVYFEIYQVYTSQKKLSIWGGRRGGTNLTVQQVQFLTHQRRNTWN